MLYPPFVSWEVTNYCNHKCQYCYNCNVEQSKIRSFDDTGISEIIDFIIDHKPVGVSVSGGEPLLFLKESETIFRSFATMGFL